jgi:quinol monooxygenase YgiN
MEIELIVKWKIRQGKTPVIMELLPELAEETKKEAGNIAYTVYRSESDPDVLILHEKYADAYALEAHKNSAHYQVIVMEKVIPHLETREVNIVKKMF